MTDKPATRTPRTSSRTTRPRAAKPKPTSTEAAQEEAAPLLGDFTTDTTTEEKRIPLFSIDGHVYTIPAEPKPTVGLRFLDALKRYGNPVMAGLELLEAMLGLDSYQRFLAWPDLDDDRLTQVINECSARALGEVERPAKN